MIQLVARARPGTLLFREHAEARALWDLLTTAFPEAEALVLMPDHTHIDVPHDEGQDRLANLMSGFARWRNHRRGEHGQVWAPQPAPRVPADAKHARRLRRYTLLNPCRAKLTRDPLSWPWCLHRDLVGLGDAHPPVPDPVKHHAYVSGDPTVAVGGTQLPVTQHRAVTWAEVLQAVCGVLREPESAATRGPVRAMALRTAWAHEWRDVGALAEASQASRRTVQVVTKGAPTRGQRIEDPLLAACVRVVGDKRFRALEPGDLRPRLRGTIYGGLE